MEVWKVLAAIQFLVLSLGTQAPGSTHGPLESYQAHNARVQLEKEIQFTVNETEISGAAVWVSVSWDNVRFPSYDDFLALYPDGADPSKTAPIKFKLAIRSITHLLLGSGTASFRVLNMRHPVRFAFLRGGLEYPRIASWSAAIIPTSPNLPLQGHISLTATPGQVVVHWVTRDMGKAPQVQWGRASGSYARSALARGPSPKTYTRDDMCGAPANSSGWFDPGWMHSAVMDDLIPGETYYYRYGDPPYSDSSSKGDGGSAWSNEAQFSAPKPAGPEHSVRILAVADLGQAEADGSLEVSQMQASLITTKRLREELDAGAYDLLVHNGDISYARGYSTQWDVYWDQLSGVVTRVPYMTSIGNHERDWPGTGSAGGSDSGGECGVAYDRRTSMPTEAEDAPWYSFDIGPVHFLQYSTEHPFHKGTPQHQFIAADLESVNRTTTPWVVVGGHRPIYIDSVDFPLWPAPDHDQVMARALRDAFEDLFIEHGVDVTWHGHHHSYQRTCPVQKGACVKPRSDGSVAAPVHLVIGHGGAGLSPNVHLLRPKIFQTVALMHGYLRVEANATHMVSQSVRSATGTIIDEFVLVKARPWEGGNVLAVAGEHGAAHRKDLFVDAL